MTDARSAVLFERAMGERFAALPAAVRSMHEVCGDKGAAGRGVVERGEGVLAGLICQIMRFPPAGSYAFLVAFAVRDGAETWTRDFGGNRSEAI